MSQLKLSDHEDTWRHMKRNIFIRVNFSEITHFYGTFQHYWDSERFKRNDANSSFFKFVQTWTNPMKKVSFRFCLSSIVNSWNMAENVKLFFTKMYNIEVHNDFSLSTWLCALFTKTFSPSIHIFHLHNNRLLVATIESYRSIIKFFSMYFKML